MMRRFREVTAFHGQPIRIFSPDGRLIAEIRRAEHDRLPRLGWLLDGDDTLYKTPTGAVMAAVWRHNQARTER